jgi:hypothetical protein
MILISKICFVISLLPIKTVELEGEADDGNQEKKKKKEALRMKIKSIGKMANQFVSLREKQEIGEFEIYI